MSELERERFDRRYRVATSDVMTRIERDALGGDYGANGYTNCAQADEIGASLSLTPASILLDLGSGCGWPGLHLAAGTGCAVVCVDPVASGVERSRRRAIADGMASDHLGVVGDGRSLPIASQSVDAVVHVDVLCWTRQKLSVLRACRRVLRRGGRMAFTVIEAAPDLPPAGRRRARAAGPWAVLTRSTYPSMLRTAGFVATEVHEVTDQYRSTLVAWSDATERREAQVRAQMGDDWFDERRADRRAALAAIDDGVLVRRLYVATVP